MCIEMIIKLHKYKYGCNMDALCVINLVVEGCSSQDNADIVSPLGVILPCVLLV